MVLLRTVWSLDRYCFQKSSQITRCVWLNLKPKGFSTSSNFRTRGHWNRSKIDGFRSQIESESVDVHNLRPDRLVKPFFFTVAFSATSLSAAAIWQYENTRHHFREWKSNYYQRTGRNWNSLNPALQFFIPICLANALVFLAWRVPKWEFNMIKYFCCNPAAKNNCWPMVLSTFSHQSVFHIFANMYVLQSFCTAATISMGKEQLFGFYMAAGVISSFASYIHKVLAVKPGLSLGASGAIMAVLGYTCVTYPDIELSIILLPFITFKAGIAIKFIMGLDLAGIILCWRIFDHAAHLGGAAFGIFWGLWGSQHIWKNRDMVVKRWRELKK